MHKKLHGENNVGFDDGMALFVRRLNFCHHLMFFNINSNFDIWNAGLHTGNASVDVFMVGKEWTLIVISRQLVDQRLIFHEIINV